MMKALVLAASAATLFGGAAQAHGYGHDRDELPPPPYAHDGHAYSLGGRGHDKGFPLLGANAGITVLGVHLGASGKLRLGLDDELREHHSRRVVIVKHVEAPVARDDDEDEDGPGPCCERGRW